MTTAPVASNHDAIPPLTRGWRMQMSLAYAGMDVAEIAMRLDVSRSTISRWLNDRGPKIKPIYLAEWARITDVSYAWLQDEPEGDLMNRCSANWDLTSGFVSLCDPIPA